MMCSIANLFGTNIRKFDAKKNITSKPLNLIQPKLSVSYKENVAAIFQSVNVFS